MINDAAKRAVEMNKRSTFNNSPKQNSSKQTHSDTEPKKKQTKSTKSSSKDSEFDLFNINIDALLQTLLTNFGLDEDKALILVLMFVLYKQKADMNLILALAYILI